jgi:hypothetical protein
MRSRAEIEEEIRSLIRGAEIAEEQAQRPHFLSAGRDLLEARSHFSDDAEFRRWLGHEFKGRVRRSLKCMQLAKDDSIQQAKEIEAARAAGYM